MKRGSDCTRCGSCGFWVRRAEKTCPNCGLRNPSRKFDAKRLLLVSLLSFSSSIVSLIVLFTAFLYVEPAGALKLLFLVPAALALPGIVSVGRFLWGSRKNRGSLLESGQGILRRIKELDKLAERVLSLRNRLKDLGNGERKRALFSILSEAAIQLERYSRDYRIQLCRYEILRWYNGLLPLSAGMETRDFGEGEKILSELSELAEEGERLLTGIVSDSSIAGSEGGRKTASELRGRIAHCRKLYEEALTVQARNLLKGISPSSLAAHDGFPEEILRSSSVETDVREAMLDLSDNFRELEREYERFRQELRLEKM